MTETKPAATGEQIVYHFINLSSPEKFTMNWGCTGPDHTGFWDVPDTDTYINGVMLWLDQDYEMAYLLQVVERGPGMVTYLAIECNVEGVDWAWHPARPHEFFKRPDDLTNYDLYRWFIEWYECNQEVRRERR